MADALVRLISLELQGIKNVRHGLVEMPSSCERAYDSKTTDILGIYGQNGSGKTAVIEAMGLIQTLLTGRSLSAEAARYISAGEKQCAITARFFVQAQDDACLTEYHVELSRTENGFAIARETLGAAGWDGEKPGKRRVLLDYLSQTEGAPLAPKYRWEDLVRADEENRINLGFARKTSMRDGCSFLFGEEARAVFHEARDGAGKDYAWIVRELHRYACLNLFVIPNAHSGAISLNLVVPFSFRLNLGESIAKGDLPIRLDGPSVISMEHDSLVRQIIDEMNLVLGTLVPGLSIGVHDFGEQLLADGRTGKRIELVSRRGELEIPLHDESEGIIKMVSILNAILCIYNNPSMCLMIDELDSGIFEYLLGELLSVLQQGAKGQLVFTSHNLRALEMLEKKSILFSTTNPDCRYIRLQNVKRNHNLRDTYLRSILLGGQKEEIYAETDSVEISRAFRRAGRAMQHGGED